MEIFFTFCIAIMGFLFYKKQKKLDLACNTKSEFINNRQKVYIELNKILFKFQNRVAFWEEDKDFEIIAAKILKFNKNYKTEESLDNLLLIPLYFENLKNFSKTVTFLSVFYEENSIYFSDRIEKYILNLIRELTLYCFVMNIICEKSLLFLSRKQSLVQRTKKEKENIEKHLHIIMYFYLKPSLDKNVVKIYRQLIKEFQKPDVSYSKSRKYPRHILYDKKRKALEKIFNKKSFKGFVESSIEFLDLKMKDKEKEHFYKEMDKLFENYNKFEKAMREYKLNH